jgi:hypothetical protein
MPSARAADAATLVKDWNNVALFIVFLMLKGVLIVVSRVSRRSEIGAKARGAARHSQRRNNSEKL